MKREQEVLLMEEAEAENRKRDQERRRAEEERARLEAIEAENRVG